MYLPYFYMFIYMQLTVTHSVHIPVYMILEYKVNLSVVVTPDLFHKTKSDSLLSI